MKVRNLLELTVIYIYIETITKMKIPLATNDPTTYTNLLRFHYI